MKRQQTYQVENMVSRRLLTGRVKRIVAFLSAFVLLTTMNSLKFDADTLERIATCGFVEHAHSETCYDDGGALTCGLEAHVHTDACYQQRPTAENTVATRFDPFIPLNTQVNLASDLSNDDDGQADAALLAADEEVIAESEMVDAPVPETELDLHTTGLAAAEDDNGLSLDADLEAVAQESELVDVAVEDELEIADAADEAANEPAAEETVEEQANAEETADEETNIIEETAEDTPAAEVVEDKYTYEIGAQTQVLLSAILEDAGIVTGELLGVGTTGNDGALISVDIDEEGRYVIAPLASFDRANLLVTDADGEYNIALRNAVVAAKADETAEVAEGNETVETTDEVEANETEAVETTDEVEADETEFVEVSDESEANETESVEAKDEAVEGTDEVETDKTEIVEAKDEAEADETEAIEGTDEVEAKAKETEAVEAKDEAEAKETETVEGTDEVEVDEPEADETEAIEGTDEAEITSEPEAISDEAATVENDNVTIVPIGDTSLSTSLEVRYAENEDKQGVVDYLNALLEGGRRSRKLMAANRSAEVRTDRYSDYAVFDISLLDDGVEQSETGDVGVVIRPRSVNIYENLPENARVTGVDYVLYHIHGDSVETLPANVDCDADGTLLSVDFTTPNFSSFVLKYTVEYAITDKEIDVTVDFKEIVINGVDFDKETVISALNDGVAVNLDELEKGYGENESAVQEFVAYSTADNKVVDTLSGWAAMDATATEGLSVVNGQIRVTADGTVTLTDGETTIVITIVNYTRLLADAVQGEGVSIDVLEGEVPAGSKVTYTERSEDETAELAEAYEIENAAGAFDVSIAMPEGDVYTGEGQFKVTVDAPEVPEGGKLNLFHIHDGEAKEIESEIVDGKLTFVTPSFSDFVYTVDFEYTDPETGEKFAWKWPGEGSYKISDIMAQIGVEGEISDVSLVRTVDMGGSEKVLYLEEKEDGWYLTSEKAFTDTFELKITVSGTVYVVTVTDTASTTNLNDLLKSFTVTGATQNPDGSYTVKPGKPYAVDIVFQESEQTSAFDDNGNLVFTVPQGLTLSNFTSPFDINVNEAGANFTVSGNTIVANGNTITIHFNQEDPNFSKLQGISTTELRVHGDVTFDNMTNGATYTVGTDGIFKVDSNPDVNIAKSGRIVDFEHGTVSYTLTVTSNGKNTGIIVTDTITGDALTLNQDVVMKDAGNNTLNPTVTYDGNQFVLQTGALNDGTYYINYTAQLDMDKLDADIWNNGSMGTGDDTNNRIEWLDKHQDYNIGHVVEAPRVEKRAGTATTDEATGVATIPWTIEADSNYYENWKLTEVTDTIKTAGMHYSGDGITVTITDHVTGNTVGTYTKTWTEMGVDPSTATGWTFDMSSLANNYQKYWHYKIEYTTEYDVSSYNSQVQVKNETTTTYDPDPHEGVGTVNPTHSNSTGISKSMENTSQTEVTWRITLGIPQGGLDAARAVVTEYLPSAGSYVDGYKAGSFRYVSGNLTGDGNPEITDNGDGTVTFRWLNGFAPNTEDGQRTLVFELKTTNNQDWMDDTSVTNNHKNHAEFDTGHGYADAFPVKPMFRKTGSNYQVVNDDLYFYFNVVTNNLNPEAIQQHGGLITFTDAFDSHLEYVEGSAKIYGGKDANNINATWQHCQLTPAISGNTMTFTVTVDDLPGENVYDSDSGSWIENPVKDFTFYKISYTMKVKDREALTEAALRSDAYTVVMGNTITSVLGSDSTTVEYTPKVLEKYKGNEVDGRIEFTIKVNEAKADLATGDVLVLTDTMHNLSAHYEDIHVAVQDYTTPVTMTNEAGQSVQLPYFNMKGDVITFYLPDNYETIITYTAMPVGEVDSNGYIHYNNVANLNGYEKEVDNWARYSGTAAGTATNYGVKLYKANGYINSQKLAGAKFKLYIVDEVDEDGNIVSGSPLKDNSTGKDYIVTSSDTGEVLVMGDVTVQGWNLKPEQRYYLLEVEAPEGCAIDNTKYEFVISQKGYANYTSRYVTAPDGSGAIIQPWTYYNGDVLTVKNYPIKGILDIKKTFEGINSATMDDNQKAAIRFEVYKQKNDGSWTKFKTIGYDEFVTDTYTIGDLDAGTYKVLEIVDDTTCQSTTYAVTHSADSVEASGQYVTVVVSEEDIRSVTHHEVNVNNTYDVPSEFKVYKYADYADNHLMTDMKLAGAEFGVFPYNAGDGTLGVQIGENYVTNSRGRFSVVPVDGSIVYDTVYALKEVKAPEGYQLSEQVYYFCFLGEGTSTLPSNAPANTVAIPYKTASTDQQIPNAFDTTTLGVRKLWQTDTLEEDTEKTDGVTVRILRSAYYNKAGTVLEETESGYFPANNSTFTVSYETDHWALSTEATLPTGVSIDASGRLTGLPTVKVLPNGALLYYKYTVEEAPVNGYNASYAYTTELDGSEQVTITNRPNSVKSMVKVHARKKWVDPAGNDVTSDMGLTDGVSLDVYRVAGVLNKGVVKQGTNEYDARALFPLTFSLSGDGTIDRTSMVCLPGDRLRVTIKPLEYNNSHTFADTDAVNINIRYYNGSYFEYTRDDVNEVLICEFDADNTKTGVEISQNSGQYSFEATVENLSAVGRTQVLTQAEAASVGGTKVETLTLNKQNGWYDESEEYSSGSASTVYTYYVVEQNGSKTDATYTVDGDSVLVTNVDKKLKVDKKWLKADDTEISNKTDGTVEYTLYQSSAAIPTVNIDWAVTYGQTGWGQTPIDLTATGQKTGIKKGSNVTIKLSAPANNGNDGSLDLPDSFFTGGASITKGTYDGSVAERIYTINNIQHNVSIRGLLAANSAVAITAEITVDESTASDALAPTVTALGSITVGYNSIEANTVDSAYPVRVGNAPWSILISKLPSADDDHIFTYYVAETAINGFDTTYEPAGVGVAPGSTITVKNQKQPTGSLRIEKELQGLTYDELTDAQKQALSKISFTVKNASGETVATVTLGHALEGKTIGDLAPGTYTVTETRPNDSTPSGFAYKTTTVAVTDGTGTTGDKSATATVAANQTVTVTFDNEYERSTGALKLTKLVTLNGSGTTTGLVDGVYTFTVTSPTPATGTVATVVIKVVNGVATQYKLNDATSFTDLPENKYVVIPDLNEGDYVITETEVSGMTTKVSGGKESLDNSPARTITVHVTAGVDEPAAAATATFTNDKPYIEANIPGMKVLENDVLTAEQFSFTIAADSSNSSAPMPVQTTVSNAANGSFSFGPIAYKLSDLGNENSKAFKYTISEQQEDESDIVYDNQAIEVTVTVTKGNDGKLSAVVDKDANAVKFTNKRVTRLPVEKTWKKADGTVDNVTNSTVREVAFTLHYQTKQVADASGNAVTGEPTPNTPVAYTGADVTNKTVTVTYNTDDTKSWKGAFEGLPKYLVTEQGKFEYIWTAKETKIVIENGTENGIILDTDEEIAEYYQATGNLTTTEGKVIVDNRKQPTEHTVSKTWNLNGVELPTVQYKKLNVTYVLHQSINTGSDYVETSFRDEKTVSFTDLTAVDSGCTWENLEKWGTATIDEHSYTGAFKYWATETKVELEYTKDGQTVKANITDLFEASNTGDNATVAEGVQTITNTQKVKKAKVVKVWKKWDVSKNDYETVNTGVAVEFKLIQTYNGAPHEYGTITLDGTTDDSETTAWQYQWPNLPAYVVDGSNVYDATYSVEEVVSADAAFTQYSMTNAPDATDTQLTVFTAVNRYTGFEVEKHWVSPDGTNALKDGVSITLRLNRVKYASNGEMVVGSENEVDTVTFTYSESDNTVTRKQGTDGDVVVQANGPDAWKFSWDMLPVSVTENETTYTYKYVVKEDALDGYNTAYAVNGQTGAIPAIGGGEVVTNTKFSTVSLPSTGGTGTTIFYGAGLSLMLFAFLGFILNARKRSRGEGI